MVIRRVFEGGDGVIRGGRLERSRERFWELCLESRLVFDDDSENVDGEGGVPALSVVILAASVEGVPAWQ